MNPKKIFLFIICTFIALLFLTLLSREYTNDQTAIVSGVKVGSVEIKYPTIKEILHPKEKVTNDKAEAVIHGTSIPTQEEKIIDSVSGHQPKLLVLPKKERALKDSLRLYLLAEKPKLLSNIEGKIYYPAPAEDFVQKLHDKLSQKKCKILHFGDSKIEGDRITSYLRNWLQIIYGGTGPGYFSIKMPYNQQSVREEISGDWYRYALFNADQRRKKELLKNNQYGLYANVSRFTPVELQDTTSVKNASFTIKPSYAYYNRLAQYSIMNIYYGNCISPTTITVYENDNQIRKETLKADGKYHNYQVTFNSTPKKIKVELASKISPDFYGVSLESAKGVQIDNIPTRGDSGFHFTKLQNTFDAMSNDIKPDIFIFQYGGNLVPSLTKDKISASVKRIITNIKWVKRRNPNALCIWIGPSDMLKRDTQTSYDILPEFIEEMKKQSLENGIAYWSMYEAMGGKNSMKIWYDNKLGSGDFTHFTETGTERISELLFEALLKDLLTVQSPEMYQ
ncbi:MAG: lipase [Capnocytophaga sp.]|nr:lipase [Capnocytophaga sp.]